MKIFNLIIGICCLSAFISCEKEITVKLPTPEEQLVVEGYIENDKPPYVFLTKSTPYFGSFDINDLPQYFVSGADITVYSDSDSVQLVEYSSEMINLLPEEERRQLSIFFGIPLDSNLQLPKISIYTVPMGSSFVGAFHKSYRLKIQSGLKVLTAVTSIPGPVGFEKLWVEQHPNPQYDTLVMLYGRVKDPDTLGNFYRYFTRKNEMMFSQNFQSVLDDLLANGKEFDIQIPYGIDRFGDHKFDINTFGYWNKKDTCYVKLSCIDRAHYLFRRSLEDALGNQGSPFGGYTRVQSNIVGGLGIWGGLASTTSVYYPQP